MKVTLKYEEAKEKDLHMTLRLTLPQKYINGSTLEVIKLFVDHYNKKHSESTLDGEVLVLKIVGGDYLDHKTKVREVLASGDECYLLPHSGGPLPAAEPRVSRSEAAPAADGGADPQAPTPSAPSSAPREGDSASSKASAKPLVKDEKGRVKCKRFGCNQLFDPDGEPAKCCHHKAPPIFHETAKWWSCCPDRKAYDWEEFMRIPGCQTGFCSANPDGQQGQKRFLGGCDLRADSAPVRLDADAPKDPRHKLDDLRKGMLAIGVDIELFDKVWTKIASEQNGDMQKVCDVMRTRFAAVVTNA